MVVCSHVARGQYLAINNQWLMTGHIMGNDGTPGVQGSLLGPNPSRGVG